ncbi:MAG: hypothetical protein KAT62_11475, partial [Desulfuromonadales bacterium]|nr:hypothetical protein [Desulfuromonadales bacterium]
SLERLSSGYRINKAADDAAGLAISQSFRADIASFKVASRNTSEASALLQVAEGGFDQIGNMLTRLKELATQSASANVGDTEREKINAEGNALVSEIDRIAQSTKYGSTALLDGTFGASKTSTVYSTAGVSPLDMGVENSMAQVWSMDGTATNLGFTMIGLTTGIDASTYTFSVTDSATLALGNGTVTESITTLDQELIQTMTFSNLGLTFSVTSVAANSTNLDAGTIAFKQTGLTSLNVTGANTGSWTITDDTTKMTLNNGTIQQTISNIASGTATDLNFDSLGITFSLGSTWNKDDLDNVVFLVSSTGSGGSTFQVGAENDEQNRLSFSISSVRATATTGLALTYDYLDSSTEAQSMLDLVDAAISSLSSRRGDVGSAMNRLTYAAANLATVIENVQAAESVIRDVDMASEMTDFTKNQILLQAGTAMLAQANMAPQQVLALFG